MRVLALSTAIAEAERFLRAARKIAIDPGKLCVDYGAKQAAVKRASLDLTKALAALRARE